MDPSPIDLDNDLDIPSRAHDAERDTPASITPEFATEHTLTPSDVAAIFNVRPKTVSRWADSGELPCITTPGGHRRFRQADVVALLNEG